MLGLIRSVITQRDSLYPIFFYTICFSLLRCFHCFRFNSNILFLLFGYSLLSLFSLFFDMQIYSLDDARDMGYRHCVSRPRGKLKDSWIKR